MIVMMILVLLFTLFALCPSVCLALTLSLSPSRQTQKKMVRRKKRVSGARTDQRLERHTHTPTLMYIDSINETDR